jgi:hypothetical protein
MLKAVLTELHANDAFLIATLVATGHLDANSSSERKEAVLAEMRSELEAAGIEAPVAPAAAASVAPVAGPVADPAPGAPANGAAPAVKA